MAIAFDSSGATRVTTSATSATVDITSAAVGAWAYCLLAIASNETSTTFTGWTLVTGIEADESTATHYALYRRLKQSGDTTFSVSWSATGAHATIGWVSYAGLNGTTPDELAAASLHTTGTSFVSPTATPTTTGRWALTFNYARDTTAAADLPDGSTWTADAALTERLDAANAAGSSPWMSVGAADSNGIVAATSQSYTSTAAHTESHGASILLFLVPPSGTSANVTGVGAAVSVVGGTGTPAGAGSITGIAGAISAGGGIGTPSGSASATGVGAQATAAGGIGTPSGGANVTGTGAAITAAGGAGTPSGGGKVTGTGPAVAVAGGVGTPSGGAGVTGVGAALTVAAGTGTPSGSASITGVGAQISVAAGIGTPSAGNSANVAGVGAQAAAQAGAGIPSVSATVTGAGAVVTAACGIGIPAGTINGSVNVTGIGAVVLARAGTGFPTGGNVFLVDASCVISFQARVAVTAQAAMSFNAGQAVQAGLITLASAPWIAMYPDTL